MPILLLVLGAATQAGTPAGVLVFSRTEGFRHASIPAGIALVQSLGQLDGYSVETTEDADAFTPANLARFDAVVWLSTTGDVLDGVHEQAYEAWLAAGGGYVGVHAAADCEYAWPWYGALLGNGAWFLSHPAIQTAAIDREDATHDSTRELPVRFDFTDEWYNFRANPRGAATILLRLDEASYAPGSGAMGADHPIAWSRQQGNGRVWYTGLGHRNETYADPRFRSHLRGGILWAMGRDGQVYADGFE